MNTTKGIAKGAQYLRRHVRETKGAMETKYLKVVCMLWEGSPYLHIKLVYLGSNQTLKLYSHYQKVKACQVDYDNNVHYFVLKGRYFDSSILHVKETDDLFDNFKMDNMPRVAVFKTLLNSKEFDHVVHGMVSGTVISQLILGGVQESIKRPLAMVRQQLD